MTHIVFIKQINSYQLRWGKQKKNETMCFSVKNYGSKEAAFKECIKYQIAIDKHQKPIEKSMIEVRPSNNKSGIRGMRISWRTEKSGNIYAYLEGNYQDKNGKNKMYHFSIEKNGLEGAIKLALKKRGICGKPVPTVEECLLILTPQYKT